MNPSFIFQHFRPFPKIHFLTILCICICLLQSCDSSNPSEQVNGPNVIILVTDDQGYFDVACMGATDLKTPYLDALYADGMRFDNFYANCPVCSPTRAALLSGRYPEYVGVPGVIRTYAKDNWGFMDPQAILLSEKFQSAGYHTALIGKWHLGLESPNTPNDRGFDHFHGWLGDMMDDYVVKRRHGINYMRLNDQEIDPPGHATDIFTDYTIDYLADRKNETSPFFLYLNYNAPHFPVQPKVDWLAKVFERETGIDTTRAKLVAFIEHLDDGIGQVIQALKANGQYENTLFVFTSDNGGLLRDAANNGPFRDGKQSVYEGGLRVPTSVVWPGNVAAGSRTDHIALSMDLYPTVLEACGISVDHAIEGKSFLPVLLGKQMDDKDRIYYFSRREGGMRYGGKTIEAVRKGDWKMLQNDPFAPRELYNLKEDPFETTDLANKELDKMKEMNALLMQHIQRRGAVQWQKNP